MCIFFFADSLEEEGEKKNTRKYVRDKEAVTVSLSLFSN